MCPSGHDSAARSLLWNPPQNQNANANPNPNPNPNPSTATSTPFTPTSLTAPPINPYTYPGSHNAYPHSQCPSVNLPGHNSAPSGEPNSVEYYTCCHYFHKVDSWFRELQEVKRIIDDRMRKAVDAEVKGDTTSATALYRQVQETVKNFALSGHDNLLGF